MITPPISVFVAGLTLIVVMSPYITSPVCVPATNGVLLYVFVKNFLDIVSYKPYALSEILITGMKLAIITSSHFTSQLYSFTFPK